MTGFRGFRILSTFGILVFLAFVANLTAASSQTIPESPYYSRLNTLGVLVAYANDSSHIIMGESENRKLLTIGVSYNRRLFHDRAMTFQYSAEILPVALESDPVQHFVNVWTSPVSITQQGSYTPVYACQTKTGSYSEVLNGVTYAYTYTDTCSRQWTIGEAMSPAGFQWNFGPRHKLQPYLTGHVGYIFSTHAIPIDTAGSFNFMFDAGAGVELYRSKSRSVRLDYRFHHISNADTANANPGIDNGIFQATYTFGR